MTDNHYNRTSTRDDWATYYSSRTEEAATWQATDEADFRNLPHTSLMNLLARFLPAGGG